ncbi:MAG: IRE (iron responsive element), partial [Planctomycetia bacterium]|nr:IRE (iron responsive element) [Planctomycetia bacterium]
MTQEKRFYRKIMYIVIIAILIIPLYLLGNPAQKSPSGKLTRGGQLARMRDANGLAEVNLGQIDPASSTMKLATFGMRGVAIALLWNRSLEHEKRADWNNVVATGNQIIMLEPHFITIWDFVGWKLAYNASAQFDDYRERYRWVIRGFEFLQKGTEYNQTAPRLFSKAGWTISQKIGIADEKDQYRRLFREDEDFHSRQLYKERDNWLFGRNYYLRAEELFEMGGSIGNETR